MLILVSEDDPQALEIIRLLKQSYAEDVMRGRNLILRTSTGNFVRERDGSLPTRLTLVGHGSETHLGDKTVDALVKELKEQLGNPTTTPIKTIDLVACEIGLVGEAKKPTGAYCYADEVAMKLKALGYNIKINAFSNRGHSEPIYSMEFTKVGDQFCLIGYKTKSDFDKNNEIFELQEKIVNLTSVLSSTKKLSMDFANIIEKNIDNPAEIKKALGAYSKKLGVPLKDVADAYRTFKGMEDGIAHDIKETRKQISVLAKQIDFVNLGAIDEVRDSLDRNPHFSFPMSPKPAPTLRQTTTASLLKTMPPSVARTEGKVIGTPAPVIEEKKPPKPSAPISSPRVTPSTETPRVAQNDPSFTMRRRM